MTSSDHKNAILFRFATTEDAKAISEVAIATFRETFDEHNTEEDMNLYCSTALSQRQVEIELKEKDSWFILAYDTNSLMGYARLRRSEASKELAEENAIEIERLYIRQAYIGQQIGSLLMQKCLDHATQLGHKVIWLGVWEHNKRALAFYRKWEFAEFGSHPFLLGKDLQTDLLMKRSL